MSESESRIALLARTPAETEALGARLAAQVGVGDVVFLMGPLGAGKTTFARGLIRAWTGLDENPPSPTYTLVQTYEGPRGALWHADLYRLNDPEDCLELGLAEAFRGALTLIEWPERLGRYAPADRIEVRMRQEGESRRIALSPVGRRRGERFVA